MNDAHTNDPPPKEFEAYLNPVIDSIAASPGRKKIMRADLFDHLLQRYRAERGSCANDQTAVQSAINRLGSPNELREQLQASVPIVERLLFSCLNRKETVMSRWLCAAAVIAILVGDNFNFPQHEQLFLAGMILLCGLIVRHLHQKNNFASRLIGSRWPWLVGCFAVLFGIAIILPAMAKIKHEQAFSLIQIEFGAMGMLIALSGIGYIAYAIKRLTARPA
jgi:hypothetical protein